MQEKESVQFFAKTKLSFEFQVVLNRLVASQWIGQCRSQWSNATMNGDMFGTQFAALFPSNSYYRKSDKERK